MSVALKNTLPILFLVNNANSKATIITTTNPKPIFPLLLQKRLYDPAARYEKMVKLRRAQLEREQQQEHIQQNLKGK